MSNQLFPIFLKLSEVRTLIVGGGSVAFEKISALLKNDSEALITIVSPQFNSSFNPLLDKPNIEFIHRKFLPEDLDKVNIILLATNDPNLNKDLKEIIRKTGKIVNVVDTPDMCDFYLGSTVQKGDLKIGISTNGKSPTLAKRLREMLDEVIPDNIQTSMERLNAIRNHLKGDLQKKIDHLNKLTEEVFKNKD